MGCGERRKRKCCHTLLRPDRRSRARQHYCSAPACRAASKAASQARWLSRPENQDYFRGPENVARVQAWRSRHPGYRRKGRPAGPALQDVLTAQHIDLIKETDEVARPPLQDVLSAQPAVLIGLIAHLVGTPLQDDIVAHRPNPGERHWTFGRWRSRGAFFIGPVLCVRRQTRPLSFAKAAAQLLNAIAVAASPRLLNFALHDPGSASAVPSPTRSRIHCCRVLFSNLHDATLRDL